MVVASDGRFQRDRAAIRPHAPVAGDEQDLAALLRSTLCRSAEHHVWLTIEQFAVLSYLGSTPVVRKADILAEFDDRPAVIMRQVMALERRGFVDRREPGLGADRDDLRLTTGGRDARAAVEDSRTDAVSARLANRTPAEIASLRAMLRRYVGG